MLNAAGRAGTAIVSPLWKNNDPVAAEANWKQLAILLGTASRFTGAVTIQLLAGLFYLGLGTNPLLQLDEAMTGLTVRGMGAAKTLLVSASDGISPIRFVSKRVDHFSIGTVEAPPSTQIINVTDIENYDPGDVVYIWTENTANTRSVSHRRVIQTVDMINRTLTLIGKNPSLPNPVRFKHVKGIALMGVVSAGDLVVELEDAALASRLTVGDDVLISCSRGFRLIARRGLSSRRRTDPVRASACI
jgi:hypothetical protein